MFEDEEEKKVKFQEELFKANTPRGDDKMKLDEWISFSLEKVFTSLEFLIKMLKMPPAIIR
jgi:hypothetical protein